MLKVYWRDHSTVDWGHDQFEQTQDLYAMQASMIEHMTIDGNRVVWHAE